MPPIETVAADEPIDDAGITSDEDERVRGEGESVSWNQDTVVDKLNYGSPNYAKIRVFIRILIEIVVLLKIHVFL